MTAESLQISVEKWITLIRVQRKSTSQSVYHIWLIFLCTLRIFNVYVEDLNHSQIDLSYRY